jgi:hypothetical protein
MLNTSCFVPNQSFYLNQKHHFLLRKTLTRNAAKKGSNAQNDRRAERTKTSGNGRVIHRLHNFLTTEHEHRDFQTHPVRLIL